MAESPRPVSPLPQSPTKLQTLTDAKSKVRSSPDFTLSLIEQRFTQLDPGDEGLATDRIQTELRFLLGCSTLTEEECKAMVHDICGDEKVKRTEFLSSFKEFAQECHRDRRGANPLTGGAARRLHTRSSSFWNLVHKTADSQASDSSTPERPLSPHSPLHQSPLHKQYMRRLQGIHATPSSQKLIVTEHQKTEFAIGSPMSEDSRPASRSASASLASSPVVRSLSLSDDPKIVEVSSPRVDRINELEDERARLNHGNTNLTIENKKLLKQLETTQAKLSEVTNEKHRLLQDVSQKDSTNQALSEKLKKAKAKRRKEALLAPPVHLPSPTSARPRSSSFRAQPDETIQRQTIEHQSAQISAKDEQIATLVRQLKELSDKTKELQTHLDEHQEREKRNESSHDLDGLNYTSIFAEIPGDLSGLDHGSALFEASAIGDLSELDPFHQHGQAEEAHEHERQNEETIDAADQHSGSDEDRLVLGGHHSDDVEDPDTNVNGYVHASNEGESGALDFSHEADFCSLLTEHRKQQEEQIAHTKSMLEEAKKLQLILVPESRLKATTVAALLFIALGLFLLALLSLPHEHSFQLVLRGSIPM